MRDAIAVANNMISDVRKFVNSDCLVMRSLTINSSIIFIIGQGQRQQIAVSSSTVDFIQVLGIYTTDYTDIVADYAVYYF